MPGPDAESLALADLQEQADDLIAEAEAELGRPLDGEERDSLLDEFLAGLDDAEAEPPDAVDNVLDQVAAEFLLTPEEREALLDD